MKTIQYKLELDKQKYYEKHLSIVSCLLPTHLTPKEIEILACFLSLDKSLIETDMFNAESRKRVMFMKKLSAGGLGNYLKSMIDKKVIDKNPDTNKMKIKPFLLPNDKTQGFKLLLVNLDEKTKTNK